jgi:hypothetical protein
MDLVITKICSKCKEIKELNLFYKKTCNPDGLFAHCKICDGIKRKKYPKGNKEHYLKNRDKILQKNKEYKKNHREQINLRNRILFAENPESKLRTRLRVRLCEAIRGNYKSGSAVKDLGCSIEYLKKYIESKFKDGMTWKNWTNTGWHIDHIKPISSFNLNNKEELLKAVHYTNLQPLWAYENLSKGNKII